MESNNDFKLAGGITRVVIYPATTPLPELGEESNEGLELTLDLGTSSYTEQVTIESACRKVLHTLSFETLPHEMPLDEALMQRIIREGIIADIWLASGGSIRVGWSSRYGAEFPLRLQSSNFSSGESALNYPLQRWVWSSSDRNSLI